MRSLEDVVAVPPTAFDPAGRVDLTATEAVVRHLRTSGVHVITVNGNTGEYASIDAGERAAVVEAAIEGSNSEVIIVAGVGGDIRSAVKAAEHAVSAGAHAVMIHEPPGPFRSPSGWVDYHRAVAQAAGDRDVVPYVRDPAVNASMLAAVLDGCPNVVAVKYAVADPTRLGGLVVELGRDRVTWLCGLAELWAPFFWPAGATGFTSGLATVAPALALGMLDALRRADHDQVWRNWRTVRPFEALRLRDGGRDNVPAIKEALSQIGLIGPTVRPPISELDERGRAEIAGILASWKDEAVEANRS